MKLRTELYTTRRGLLSFGYDDDMLKHDAMAAHAMEDAKNKMGEEFAAKGVHGIVAVAVLAELDRRADEILAGWMGEDRE